MRTFLKIIFYFIIAITLLCGGLVAFTQTQIFKNWLKNTIVAEANKNLNATLSIGKINGNLLTQFQISDILLTDSIAPGKTDSISPSDGISSLPDTILSLAELKIGFSPGRLLNKEVIIKLIALNSLHFRLRQLPDSSWNAEHLLITASDTSSEAPELPEQPSPLLWRIALHNMQLIDARIDIIPTSESLFIPHRIEKINTVASLVFDQNDLKVDLKDFHLRTKQPNLTLKRLAFDLSLVKNNLTFRQLVLQTANSQIQGEGELVFSDQPKYQANLFALPIDFSEVQNFIPDFPLRIPVNLNLAAVLEFDALRFNLDANYRNQSIKLNGNIANVSENPDFQLAAMLSRVTLQDWLTFPGVTGLMNGQLDVRGNGTSEENANLLLTANFSNGAIYERSFEQIDIKADYAKGNMTSDIQAIGNFGQFQLNSQVVDILNDQKFQLDGKFSQIDLRPIILDDSLETNISLAIQARGARFDPDDMKAFITLDASPSTFLGIEIDTLFSIFTFKNYNFFIDTLDVASPLAQLHLSGNIDFDSKNHIHFKGNVGDLAQLKPILQADSLRAEGSIAGFASGSFDSLRCEANFKLSNLIYNTISINSLTGDGRLALASDSLTLQANSQIKQFGFSDFLLDSAYVTADIVNNLIEVAASVFHSDSISGAIAATLLADSVTQITIPSIALNLKNKVWSGGNDSMQVLLGPDDFEFRNIKLTSGNQFIQLGGTLSLAGNQNLVVEISDTEIAPFLKSIEMPVNIQGNIRLFMEIKGTAESPIAEGIVTITDGKVNEYDFQGAALNVSYADQLLMFIVNLNYDKTNSLVSIGSIPLNLSMTSDEEILDYDKPMELHVKADGLDFSVLQAFSEDVRKVRGKILIDLYLQNTFRDPIPSGYLRLVDGGFRLSEFGLNYKDIQANFVLDSSSVVIQQFQTQSDKGILTASGKIDYDRSGIDGVIKTTDVNVIADNFLAISNKNYEIIIGGDVSLTGNPASPKFDGAIRVLRSRFYLPALIQSSPAAAEEIKPILVDALKDSLEKRVEKTAGTDDVAKIFENLTGSIKIEIPRNTWLRSSDMNVEIAGDLDVVKQSEIFELFGMIRVLRGVYDLYGKRFKIQNGSFSFEGGPEYNPEIELIAEHVFRTFNREKKTLTLQVTGKAMTPKLQFNLDDIQISEGDAISYLLLGRSLEELTHGQRSELDQQAGFNATNEASNIMVGLVAGQLSKTIGRTLNLDVIEVKGEENWQQATFVVGKYLTNDLFLSYQKEFGFRQTNELQPDEITLEYEINRRLFLQLTKGSEKTTGFDIILKFEK